VDAVQRHPPGLVRDLPRPGVRGDGDPQLRDAVRAGLVPDRGLRAGGDQARAPDGVGRGDRAPGRRAPQAAGTAGQAAAAAGLGGHRRGGAPAAYRRGRGDARTAAQACRGGRAVERDPAGRPVRTGWSRRRERVVLDSALPGAGPARRGLHGAAHQRHLPGPAGGRGALPGGRRPAQRRGPDPGGHGALHRTARPGNGRVIAETVRTGNSARAASRRTSLARPVPRRHARKPRRR
jgi:hypothetical protein